MKKNLKRAVSLLLVLVLTLSLCTTAFASPAPLRYVAIGDSTSMGYGLDDFQDKYVYTRSSDDQSSEYSVCRRFLSYLKDRHGVDAVVGQDLCLTGMRPAELRAILDKEYCDFYMQSHNYLEDHIHYYTGKKIAPGVLAYPDYDTLSSTYAEALTNADVVTYDLCSADFGGYFGTRFIDGSGDPYYNSDTLADLARDAGFDGISYGLSALRQKLNALLSSSDLPLDTVKDYLDTLLYTYANFALNFSWTVDWIYENNPDVTLIVVGPMLTMKDITFTVGDVSLNFGQIWAALMEAVTAYVTSADPHRCQYRFADCFGGIDLIIDAFARGEFGYPYETVANQFFSTFGVDKNETIYANMQKGAAFYNVPLTDVLPVVDDVAIAREALLDFDNATDVERGVLQMQLRLIEGHSLGAHPSAEGYRQKFEAVKRAYESCVSADGTYQVRLNYTPIALLWNLIGALLGNKVCAATLRSFFRNILTLPIGFGG